MLVSSVLTCTMIIGLFSPETLLKSNFGEVIKDNVSNIIIRNWAALITLIGIMLSYGAFVPAVRRVALIIAGASKIIFIMLILSFGKQFMNFGIGTAVIVDAVMVVLYGAYFLLTVKKIK